MRIYEYETKELFKEVGIVVPMSGLAQTPEHVREVAMKLNTPVILKPQTMLKARGKARLIVSANYPEDAAQASKSIFGREYYGEIIDTILVEEMVDHRSELYLGVIVDYASGQPLVITSSAGGVEIEKTALEHPELLTKVSVSPSKGLSEDEATSLAKGIVGDIEQPASALVEDFKDTILNLYQLFTQYDCEMVEINPLGIKDDLSTVALDAALVVDHDALFRQPQLVRCRGLKEEDFQREKDYRDRGWTYLQMEGDIGILSSGAGITMAILDLMQAKGGRPANFLDTAQMDREGIYDAFRLFYHQRSIKTVLVNIFAGLNRCDDLAEGIRDFIKDHPLPFALVVRMVGNREEEGRRILKAIGITPISGLEEAVYQAIALTKEK